MSAEREGLSRHSDYILIGLGKRARSGLQAAVRRDVETLRRYHVAGC